MGGGFGFGSGSIGRLGMEEGLLSSFSSEGVEEELVSEAEEEVEAAFIFGFSFSTAAAATAGGSSIVDEGDLEDPGATTCVASSGAFPKGDLLARG